MENKYILRREGYYWINVPNSSWPLGGYFDGRVGNRNLATRLDEAEAKKLQTSRLTSGFSFV